jgi:hypothetical protein
MKKRVRKNYGKNPFKGTFFNFHPSPITSVEGLFTFLFNLMVYFILFFLEKYNLLVQTHTHIYTHKYIYLVYWY